MQRSSQIPRPQNDVLRSFDDDLIRDWRLLQRVRPFYYMATKWLRRRRRHTYLALRFAIRFIYKLHERYPRRTSARNGA